MKKIILALLVGFTITGANAQTIAQLTTRLNLMDAKLKTDSTTNAKKVAALELKVSVLETTVSKQATAIGTLQSQSTSYAGSIKAHDSMFVRLNAGKVTIDFNYFDLTPTGLRPKPIDLSAYDLSITNLGERLDKLPVIDMVKIKEVFDWLPAAKLSFLNLSK
jgi:hypothetical protein